VIVCPWFTSDVLSLVVRLTSCLQEARESHSCAIGQNQRAPLGTLEYWVEYEMTRETLDFLHAGAIMIVHCHGRKKKDLSFDTFRRS